MKILHLTSDWKWTGPAEPGLLLLQALRERGHEVELICPATPADAADPGLLDEARAARIEPALCIEVARGIRPWRDRSDAATLRSFVAERGVDVVHVWHTRAHGLALRALGVRRTAALVRAHSDGRPVGRAPWSRWLFGAGADGLFCPSQRCAASHSARRGPTRGWPGAVDLARFRAGDEASRCAARRDLGVAAAGPLVGVVARAQPTRRFDLLFEAWTALQRRLPAARLVVVGRGTNFESVVRAPVSKLGLEGSVVFAGHRRGSDYAALLRALDVLVFLVPGSDGGCRAVLEAASCGVPAVVSQRGALPEIVVDGETGGVLAAEDPALLAALLEELLTDAPRRETLGAAAQVRARRCFAASRLAEECEALYFEALEALGRGAELQSSPWSATISR